MRHVSRTHRVALDWLFDRINPDPKIQIKYIDNKSQLADILTKGNFTWWVESFVEFVEHYPFQFYTLHHCNGKTSSTRIRIRTCHSQIETCDEFDSEDAFGRVVSNFIKPGEDFVWISRSWEICCIETIDRGNLRDRHHQVIQKRIMVSLGLLKSGKVELRRTIDQKTWENFLGYDATSCPSSWRTSRRKCAFRKVRRDDSWWIGETWEIELPRRGRIRNFRHGQWRSRICEQSKRSTSAKQTEQNFERCRIKWRAFNNVGNVHNCNDECGDIHGKDLLNYSKNSSTILKISRRSRCSMSPRNRSMTKKKSMVWTKFIGERILGDVCHWLVMKQSSIFKAQKSIYSQILCCVLERFINILNPTKLGREGLNGSRLTKATEDYDGINGEADWIRVEHLPRIHNVAALW